MPKIKDWSTGRLGNIYPEHANTDHTNTKGLDKEGNIGIEAYINEDVVRAYDDNRPVINLLSNDGLLNFSIDEYAKNLHISGALITEPESWKLDVQSESLYTSPEDWTQRLTITPLYIKKGVAVAPETGFIANKQKWLVGLARDDGSVFYVDESSWYNKQTPIVNDPIVAYDGYYRPVYSDLPEGKMPEEFENYRFTVRQFYTTGNQYTFPIFNDFDIIFPYQSNENTVVDEEVDFTSSNARFPGYDFYPDVYAQLNPQYPQSLEIGEEAELTKHLRRERHKVIASKFQQSGSYYRAPLEADVFRKNASANIERIESNNNFVNIMKGVGNGYEEVTNGTSKVYFAPHNTSLGVLRSKMNNRDFLGNQEYSFDVDFSVQGKNTVTITSPETRAYQEFGITHADKDTTTFAISGTHDFRIALNSNVAAPTYTTVNLTGLSNPTLADLRDTINTALSSASIYATAIIVEELGPVYDIRIYSNVSGDYSKILLAAGTTTDLFAAISAPLEASVDGVTDWDIYQNPTIAGDYTAVDVGGAITNNDFTVGTIADDLFDALRTQGYQDFTVGVNTTLDDPHSSQLYIMANGSTQGYVELGLSGISGGDDSGLSILTEYFFKLTIDNGTETEYNFTTTSDVSYNGVITSINTILGTNATVSIVSGDIRFSSDTYGPTSTIATANGSSGTSLFGAGNFPAAGAHEAPVTGTGETITVTSRRINTFTVYEDSEQERIVFSLSDSQNVYIIPDTNADIRDNIETEAAYETDTLDRYSTHNDRIITIDMSSHSSWNASAYVSKVYSITTNSENYLLVANDYGEIFFIKNTSDLYDDEFEPNDFTKLTDGDLGTNNEKVNNFFEYEDLSNSKRFLFVLTDSYIYQAEVWAGITAGQAFTAINCNDSSTVSNLSDTLFSEIRDAIDWEANVEVGSITNKYIVFVGESDSGSAWEYAPILYALYDDSTQTFLWYADNIYRNAQIDDIKGITKFDGWDDPEQDYQLFISNNANGPELWAGNSQNSDTEAGGGLDDRFSAFSWVETNYEEGNDLFDLDDTVEALSVVELFDQKVFVGSLREDRGYNPDAYDGLYSYTFDTLQRHFKRDIWSRMVRGSSLYLAISNGDMANSDPCIVRLNQEESDGRAQIVSDPLLQYQTASDSTFRVLLEGFADVGNRNFDGEYHVQFDGTSSTSITDMANAINTAMATAEYVNNPSVTNDIDKVVRAKGITSYVYSGGIYSPEYKLVIESKVGDDPDSAAGSDETTESDCTITILSPLKGTSVVGSGAGFLEIVDGTSSFADLPLRAWNTSTLNLVKRVSTAALSFVSNAYIDMSSVVTSGYEILVGSLRVKSNNTDEKGFTQGRGKIIESTDSTGLPNDATVFTFKVTIDGSIVSNVSFAGSAAQTWGDLLTEVNNDLSGGTATLKDLGALAGTKSDIVITSSTTGSSSTVLIEPDATGIYLFSFDGIDKVPNDPVDGTAAPLTAGSQSFGITWETADYFYDPVEKKIYITDGTRIDPGNTVWMDFWQWKEFTKVPDTQTTPAAGEWRYDINQKEIIIGEAPTQTPVQDYVVVDVHYEKYLKKLEFVDAPDNQEELSNVFYNTAPRNTTNSDYGLSRTQARASALHFGLPLWATDEDAPIQADYTFFLPRVDMLYASQAPDDYGSRVNMYKGKPNSAMPVLEVNQEEVRRNVPIYSVFISSQDYRENSFYKIPWDYSDELAKGTINISDKTHYFKLDENLTSTKGLAPINNWVTVGTTQLNSDWAFAEVEDPIGIREHRKRVKHSRFVDWSKCIFVSKLDGDDGNDGEMPVDAVETLTEALNKVTSERPYIFLLTRDDHVAETFSSVTVDKSFRVYIISEYYASIPTVTVESELYLEGINITTEIDLNDSHDLQAKYCDIEQIVCDSNVADVKIDLDNCIMNTGDTSYAIDINSNDITGDVLVTADHIYLRNSSQLLRFEPTSYDDTSPDNEFYFNYITNNFTKTGNVISTNASTNVIIEIEKSLLVDSSQYTRFNSDAFIAIRYSLTKNINNIGAGAIVTSFSQVVNVGTDIDVDIYTESGAQKSTARGDSFDSLGLNYVDRLYDIGAFIENRVPLNKEIEKLDQTRDFYDFNSKRIYYNEEIRPEKFSLWMRFKPKDAYTVEGVLFDSRYEGDLNLSTGIFNQNGNDFIQIVYDDKDYGSLFVPSTTGYYTYKLIISNGNQTNALPIGPAFVSSSHDQYNQWREIGIVLNYQNTYNPKYSDINLEDDRQRKQLVVTTIYDREIDRIAILKNEPYQDARGNIIATSFWLPGSTLSSHFNVGGGWAADWILVGDDYRWTNWDETSYNMYLDNFAVSDSALPINVVKEFSAKKPLDSNDFFAPEKADKSTTLLVHCNNGHPFSENGIEPYLNYKTYLRPYEGYTDHAIAVEKESENLISNGRFTAGTWFDRDDVHLVWESAVSDEVWSAIAGSTDNTINTLVNRAGNLEVHFFNPYDLTGYQAVRTILSGDYADWAHMVPYSDDVLLTYVKNSDGYGYFTVADDSSHTEYVFNNSATLYPSIINGFGTDEVAISYVKNSDEGYLEVRNSSTGALVHGPVEYSPGDEVAYNSVVGVTTVDSKKTYFVAYVDAGDFNALKFEGYSEDLTTSNILVTADKTIQSGHRPRDVKAIELPNGNVTVAWKDANIPLSAQPEITDVQCQPDVAGSLSGTYFYIFNPSDDYYVWYDVDNSSTPPYGIKEETEIIIPGDSSSSLSGKYWTLYSPATEYYVWYNTGASSDPAPAGKTGIEVVISTDDDADTVAFTTQTEIDAEADFGATYTAAISEQTDVTFVSASPNDYGGKYWVLYAANGIGDENGYYVWYDVDDGSTDPAPGGGLTGIEVDITVGDDDEDIASKTQAQIDLESDFSALVATNVVTVTSTNPGDTTDAADGDIGGGNITFSVTQQGAEPYITVTNADYGAAADASDVDSGVTPTVTTQGVNPQSGAVGKTGIEVDIATGDSDDDVAIATQSAVDGTAGFSATRTDEVVTIENDTDGPVTHAYDENTGFNIDVTQVGQNASAGGDSSCYFAIYTSNGRIVAHPAEVFTDCHYNDLTFDAVLLNDGNILFIEQEYTNGYLKFKVMSQYGETKSNIELRNYEANATDMARAAYITSSTREDVGVITNIGSESSLVRLDSDIPLGWYKDYTGDFDAFVAAIWDSKTAFGEALQMFFNHSAVTSQGEIWSYCNIANTNTHHISGILFPMTGSIVLKLDGPALNNDLIVTVHTDGSYTIDPSSENYIELFSMKHLNLDGVFKFDMQFVPDAADQLNVHLMTEETDTETIIDKFVVDNIKVEENSFSTSIDNDGVGLIPYPIVLSGKGNISLRVTPQFPVTDGTDPDRYFIASMTTNNDEIDYNPLYLYFDGADNKFKFGLKDSDLNTVELESDEYGDAAAARKLTNINDRHFISLNWDVEDGIYEMHIDNKYYRLEDSSLVDFIPTEIVYVGNNFTDFSNHAADSVFELVRIGDEVATSEQIYRWRNKLDPFSSYSQSNMGEFSAKSINFWGMHPSDSATLYSESDGHSSSLVVEVGDDYDDKLVIRQSGRDLAWFSGGGLTVDGPIKAPYMVTFSTSTLSTIDDHITLRYGFTGTPASTADTYIETERGILPNSEIRWDESWDAYVFHDGSNNNIAIDGTHIGTWKNNEDFNLVSNNTGMITFSTDSLTTDGTGDGTQVRSDGIERFRISPDNAVFNYGNQDFDVQIKGITDNNLLYTNADADSVGIGIDDTLGHKLYVNGTAYFNDDIDMLDDATVDGVDVSDLLKNIENIGTLDVGDPIGMYGKYAAKCNTGGTELGGQITLENELNIPEGYMLASDHLRNNIFVIASSTEDYTIEVKVVEKEDEDINVLEALSISSTTGAIYPGLTAISDQRFVVIYKDVDNSKMYYYVGEYTNGGTFSWKVSAEQIPEDTDEQVSVISPAEDVFVVAFVDSNNSNYGSLLIGEYDTTDEDAFITISKKVFNNGSTTNVSVAPLTTNTFIMNYVDEDNSDYPTVRVASYIPTTGDVTFLTGSSTFKNAEVLALKATPIDDSTFVVVYEDASNDAYAVIGDYAAGAISWGAESSTLATISANALDVAYLANNIFVVGFKDSSDSLMKVSFGRNDSGSVTWVHTVPEIVYNADRDIIRVERVGTNYFAVTITDSSGNSEIGVFEYNNSAFEIYEVTCPADVSGSLDGTYWTLSCPDGTGPNNETDYYVWYNTGSSVDPAPGGTGIEVAIDVNDTAGTVAQLTAAEIDSEADFSATYTATIVTVVNAVIGNSTDAADGDAGVSVNVITQGTDYLVTEAVPMQSVRMGGTYTSDLPWIEELGNNNLAIGFEDTDGVYMRLASFNGSDALSLLNPVEKVNGNGIDVPASDGKITIASLGGYRVVTTYKDSDGQGRMKFVEYAAGGQAEVEEITVPNGSNLDGKYWYLNAPDTKYYVWYNTGIAGYQELGLSVDSSTASGLSAGTTYYFETNSVEYTITPAAAVAAAGAYQEFGLSVDGAANTPLAAGDYYFIVNRTEYSITIPGATTYSALVTLIDNEITGDALTCSLEGVSPTQDIRITHDTQDYTHYVWIESGTSGTDLFGSSGLNIIGSLDSPVAGNPAIAAQETYDHVQELMDAALDTAGFDVTVEGSSPTQDIRVINSAVTGPTSSVSLASVTGPLDPADHVGTADMSSGYDWGTTNETFDITVNGAGPNTVTLNSLTTDVTTTVTEINNEFANASPSAVTGVEAYDAGSGYVGIRTTSAGSSETFTLATGSPDALATLGWTAGVYTGTDKTDLFTSLTGFTAFDAAQAGTDSTDPDGGETEITEIRVPNEKIGGVSIGGTYWRLFSGTDEYWVWYDVDDGSVAPTPGGGEILIEVDITSGDNSTAVATSTASAIGSQADFSASSTLDMISVETADNGPVTHAEDVDSGVNIFIRQTGWGTGIEVECDPQDAAEDIADSTASVLDGETDFSAAASTTAIAEVMEVDFGTAGASAVAAPGAILFNSTATDYYIYFSKMTDGRTIDPAYAGRTGYEVQYQFSTTNPNGSDADVIAAAFMNTVNANITDITASAHPTDPAIIILTNDNTGNVNNPPSLDESRVDMDTTINVTTEGGDDPVVTVTNADNGFVYTAEDVDSGITSEVTTYGQTGDLTFLTDDIVFYSEGDIDYHKVTGLDTNEFVVSYMNSDNWGETFIGEYDTIDQIMNILSRTENFVSSDSSFADNIKLDTNRVFYAWKNTTSTFGDARILESSPSFGDFEMESGEFVVSSTAANCVSIDKLSSNTFVTAYGTNTYGEVRVGTYSAGTISWELVPQRYISDENIYDVEANNISGSEGIFNINYYYDKTVGPDTHYVLEYRVGRYDSGTIDWVTGNTLISDEEHVNEQPSFTVTELTDRYFVTAYNQLENGYLKMNRHLDYVGLVEYVRTGYVEVVTDRIMRELIDLDEGMTYYFDYDEGVLKTDMGDVKVGVALKSDELLLSDKYVMASQVLLSDEESFFYG
jgi:hypothetical protein